MTHTSTTEDAFMFDSSGKEFVHSAEIMQFFLFLPALMLFIFMVYRVFTDKPFYGESGFISKPRNEDIGHKELGFEEASPGLDDNDIKVEFGSAISPAHSSGVDSFKFETIESKETIPEFWESIYFNFFPLCGVALLNMINFSSYVFCALMFFAWILCIILFNKIKVCQSFARPGEYHYTEKIHLVFIVVLFFNYFIADQSTI